MRIVAGKTAHSRVRPDRRAVVGGTRFVPPIGRMALLAQRMVGVFAVFDFLFVEEHLDGRKAVASEMHLFGARVKRRFGYVARRRLRVVAIFKIGRLGLLRMYFVAGQTGNCRQRACNFREQEKKSENVT